MKKESYLHPDEFGNLVRSERKRLKMNQVAFYNFLFPDNRKEEETIKKKMNTIENGKQKSVDFEFLLTVCQKCEVSADYILGLKKDFRNHENEFVCSYTGLNETAVKQLHKWNSDKHNDADLSMIGKAFFEEDETAVMNAYKKQSAITFLRIINYLFKEGELPGKNRKANKPYSNLRILYSLYLMCMAKPKSLTGTPIIDDSDVLYEYLKGGLLDSYTKHMLFESLVHIRLDGRKPMFMEDNNNVIYPVKLKDILEQIARRNLDKALDQMIESFNFEDDPSADNN